ncbi:MAG: type II toxin-antitoxin system RelE/ParE family toxin [Candidatus Sumerlaeota bacterium]|nr:type II toxin-antitoxin system RelE/ParE family toxin [Candidatus Sumerlaeota bacterium]
MEQRAWHAGRGIEGFSRGGGSVPLLEWLEGLQPRARLKCLAQLRRLREAGYELRRPAADYLRDGVYELRVQLEGLQHRILYFFHGRTAVVLSHGLIKPGAKVPPKEIDQAVKRKRLFESDPDRHTFLGELPWEN